MSFYHILPSNTAKDRFPRNNASQYSIPIDDVQQLEGEWEVAVAQLTYSNCLYMFDHETIDIGEPMNFAYQCETGCRIHIPSWNGSDRETVVRFIQNFLNKACKNIMTLKPNVKNYRSFERSVKDGWIVCFSDDLRHDLGLFASAYTAYDMHRWNYYTQKPEPMIYKKGLYYVDIVPVNDKTLLKNDCTQDKELGHDY